MSTPTRLLAHLAAAATFVALGLGLAPKAQAQDWSAMIQHQMNLMNQRLAQGQQQINQIVQQRMQDPQVQAAWQRYLAQTGGRPAMDYPTFTYNYIYTNGFSADGIAHARRTEAGNQAAEQRARQGLQQAERDRAAAQQAQRDGYFGHQQEAGRGLAGQSTYQGPQGRTVLPHTWQPNSMHQHGGQTYYVDGGGRYFVRGSDGWWYPVR